MKYISVYPKADRPVWYAAFPDPKTGKRIYRATEFRRDDPQGNRKAWNWARTQARDGILTKSDGEGNQWLWVEPWLKLKHRKQKKTLAAGLLWWGWLFTYLAEKNINSPRSLDRTAVFAYIDWRTSKKRRSGKSACFNSALQEVKLLGRVMREAILRGLAESNPCERLGLKKDKPPEKPEILDSEIPLIRARLAEWEGHLPFKNRWMTISFEIALHHGCRVAETQIPLERIDWTAGTIRFHAKRGVIYTVPIHPGLRPLLDQLRAAGATITCTLPDNVSQVWTRFFKGRAERDTAPFLPHLCFHCTRVTVITRFARAGVPVQQAMAYVHHANELIHRIYQRLKPADVMKCVDALTYPPNA